MVPRVRRMMDESIGGCVCACMCVAVWDEVKKDDEGRERMMKGGKGRRMMGRERYVSRAKKKGVEEA